MNEKFYHRCGRAHTQQEIDSCNKTVFCCLKCGEENPILTKKDYTGEDLLKVKYTKHKEWLNKSRIEAISEFKDTEESLIRMINDLHYNSCIEWAKKIESIGNNVYIARIMNGKDFIGVRTGRLSGNIKYHLYKFELSLKLYLMNLKKMNLIGTADFIDRGAKALLFKQSDGEGEERLIFKGYILD